MMEKAIRKAFSNWHGEGNAPQPLIAYQPSDTASPIKTIVEKNLTDSVQLIWQRPTSPDINTAPGRKRDLLQKIALGVLDQRLTNAVQDSATAVSADASLQTSPYLGDMLGLQLTILSDTNDADREAELARAMRTLNSAIANISQAEIDRQYDVQLRAAERAVERQAVRSSPQLANDLVANFDHQSAPRTVF